MEGREVVTEGRRVRVGEGVKGEEQEEVVLRHVEPRAFFNHRRCADTNIERRRDSPQYN